MQQTTTYKLNLIEKTDPFSPDALNENTQKVENALTAHEEAVEEVTDGLDARVTALEAHKIVVGTYTGNGESNRFVNLGFTPKVVIASNLIGYDNPVTGMCIPGHTMYDNNRYVLMKIVDGGFQVSSNNFTCLNRYQNTYAYFAFA